MRHLSVAKPDTGDSVFEVGELSVDLGRREVSVGGRSVRLTRNEFRLLGVLVKNPGRVMTHRQLLREVWGPGSAEENHDLRVYMNQLRQKLEAEPARPRYLLTEPGVGYRLVSEV
jgi:two-component system, OmpR family, KDP operon response regulator KdpE